MNIPVASLMKEAAQNDQIVESFEEKEDELTGLPWGRVVAKVWMKQGSMIQGYEPIWERAAESYQVNCSTCHTQPAPAHFTANAWPGMFNGMSAFVNLDIDSEAWYLSTTETFI
ncbi:cytochrome c-type protein napC [Vibrio sp. JCM 19236]|nr:cytochrome c-type protein napC [Vibrio sp. JCM 19236]